MLKNAYYVVFIHFFFFFRIFDLYYLNKIEIISVNLAHSQAAHLLIPRNSLIDRLHANTNCFIPLYTKSKFIFVSKKNMSSIKISFIHINIYRYISDYLDYCGVVNFDSCN